jgi:hypothetical protein
MNPENEILRLMNQYCYAIDTGDFAAFGKLFAHAQWIAEGKKSDAESKSNVIIYPDGTPRTKHTLSNITIDVDEPAGEARARSYVTVYQQTPDLPLQPIYSGEYHDEFRLRDGTWQFSKREVRNSLLGDMTAHLKVLSNTFPDTFG